MEFPGLLKGSSIFKNKINYKNKLMIQHKITSYRMAFLNYVIYNQSNTKLQYNILG